MRTLLQTLIISCLSLLAACRGESERAQIDLLIEEGVLAISRSIAEVPSAPDAERAREASLAQSCRALAVVDAPPISPVCTDLVGSGFRVDARSLSASEILALLGEYLTEDESNALRNATIASTDELSGQLAAARTVRLWDWYSPIRAARAQLDASIKAAMAEDEAFGADWTASVSWALLPAAVRAQFDETLKEFEAGIRTARNIHFVPILQTLSTIAAESEAMRPPIPSEGDHLIRRKTTSDSD